MLNDRNKGRKYEGAHRSSHVPRYFPVHIIEELRLLFFFKGAVSLLRRVMLSYYKRK